jgi:hypothetical protein
MLHDVKKLFDRTKPQHTNELRAIFVLSTFSHVSYQTKKSYSLLYRLTDSPSFLLFKFILMTSFFVIYSTLTGVNKIHLSFTIVRQIE